VRIGKYAIPVLLLLTIAITTVAAAAYVILTWYVGITISDNPAVAFTDDEGVNLANTFTISGFDVFPEVRTIDENIGWNITCDATGPHSCSMRISAVTDAANIEEIYIKAYEYGSPGSPLVEVTYTGTVPTSWVDFDAAASTMYILWLEVEGAVGASGSASFDVEMRVNLPP